MTRDLDEERRRRTSGPLTIAHGTLTPSAFEVAGLLSLHDRMHIQTCNISAEEIAERDRPKSRQERRHTERKARKAGRK